MCKSLTFDFGAVALNFTFLTDLVIAITQQPLIKEGSHLVYDIFVTCNYARVVVL